MSVAGGVTMGGDFAYSLKDSAVKGYNVGASYSTGPLFAAVTSADKLGSVNLSMMYKVNSDVTVASSTVHSSSKKCSVVGVGGLYKAPFGDVKAKMGSDKVISASLVKDVMKTKVTLSGSMVGTDTSTFKYGLGVTM